MGHQRDSPAFLLGANVVVRVEIDVASKSFTRQSNELLAAEEQSITDAHGGTELSGLIEAALLTFYARQIVPSLIRN
jgi:hypothetical protein